MRVTLNDGRQMTGQMLAFDKHMNLVLADCEEFRRVRKKNAKGTTAPGSTGPPLVETEEKRTLGLAIVRGAMIISLSVDGPPPADPASRLGAQTGAPAGVPAAMQAGPGISKPVGRGLPTGLSGPVAGVGGFGGFGGAPGGPPGFGGRGGPRKSMHVCAHFGSHADLSAPSWLSTTRIWSTTTGLSAAAWLPTTSARGSRLPASRLWWGTMITNV